VKPAYNQLICLSVCTSACLPAIVGVPGVAGVHAVAFIPAVACVPADTIVRVDPGIPILVVVFANCTVLETYYRLPDYQTTAIGV
jgi:hypothetical protein